MGLREDGNWQLLSLPILLPNRPFLFHLLIKPNTATSDLNSHIFPLPESLASLSTPFQIPEGNHLINLA